MNIKITSTHVSLSPHIEKYVTEKVNSLGKFLKDRGGALCEVELGKTTEHHKSGDIYKAELNIVDAGKQYYVMAEKDDLYTAIDKMRDEAERAIVSRHKKYLTLIRRGGSAIKNAVKRLYN